MARLSGSVERVCVWLGGALFVASLACFAYFYLIQWTSFHEPLVPVLGHDGIAVDPRQAAAVDALLLTLFAAHHSVFARQSAKEWLARVVPVRLLRTTYVCVASLLLCAVCLLWQPIDRDIYFVTGWRTAPFVGVQLFGLWLAAQSVRAIDAFELAGIRNQSSSSLQIAGPYRVVRHPLYSGFLLAVLGVAHVTADRLVFALFALAYIVVAIPWEEQALSETYGSDYHAYRQRVRWRLVPYVY